MGNLEIPPRLASNDEGALHTLLRTHQHPLDVLQLRFRFVIVATCCYYSYTAPAASEGIPQAAEFLYLLSLVSNRTCRGWSQLIEGEASPSGAAVEIDIAALFS